MDNRESFEQWYKTVPDGAELTNGDMLESNGDDALAGWQACTAHHEAERNAFLAVIAEKDEALQTCTDLSAYEQCFDSDKVAEARELTPDNVRLVEVGYFKLQDTIDAKWVLVNQPTKFKAYTIEKVS